MAQIFSNINLDVHAIMKKKHLNFTEGSGVLAPKKPKIFFYKKNQTKWRLFL